MSQSEPVIVALGLAKAEKPRRATDYGERCRKVAWVLMQKLFVTILLLTTVAICPLLAQSHRGSSESRLARIQRLINDADSLPFEYRADIQLTALESSPALPKSFSERILKKLFVDADLAQYHFREIEVSPPRGSTTRSWRLAQAQTLRLDTLSIRARVTRRMAAVNAQQSLMLLRDLAVRVPPLSCHSEVVYDVSDYYASLGDVLPAEWSVAKTPTSERHNFLEQTVNAISSPVQLAPVADLIAKLAASNPKTLPDVNLDQLRTLFSNVLSRLQGSDRELSAIDEGLTKSVESLLVPGDSSRNRNLLASFGKFWTVNESEPRCSDAPNERERAIEAFNALLAKYVPDRSIAPVEVKKTTRSNIEEGPDVQIIPSFADVIPLSLLRTLAAFQTVRLVSPGDQTAVLLDETEEDENQALQLADSIDTVNAKCQECAFQEKAEATLFLFDIAPSDLTRDRALEALVRLLASDRIQETSRIEWLWHLKFLLNLARTPSKDQFDVIEKWKVGKEQYFQFLPKPGVERITDVIVRDGSPVMRQYVNAERILRNKYIPPPYITQTQHATSASSSAN